MSNSIKYVLITSIIVFFIFISESTAQITAFSVGGSIGVGGLKGNSPSQTSLSGDLFLDFYPSFIDFISIRLKFNYSQKAEYFLPENRSNRYYPFVKSFSANVFVEQYIDSKIFVEEGIGVLLLNDHTFSDVNTWNYGMMFNALAGWDLRNFSDSGFRIGFGTEYGLTFTNSSASFYSFYLQGQYFL
ncbi:MAG: hypothetical protein V1720_13395 [bacterium]